ncbi:MAG: hypothetical protein ACLFWL_06305 [Candidatus Brocadiia bacterium]
MLFIDPAFERAHKRFYGAQIGAKGLVWSARHWLGGDVGSGPIYATAGREGKAWTLEVRIPWQTLLRDKINQRYLPRPKSGDRMGLNIARSRCQLPFERSLWAETYSWVAWLPWRWGILRLE